MVMLDRDVHISIRRQASSFQRNGSLKQCPVLMQLHTSLSGQALAQESKQTWFKSLCVETSPEHGNIREKGEKWYLPDTICDLDFSSISVWKKH